MPGMGTHSDVSFNESNANAILEQKIESQKNIKAFFSKNDKTPNYDGFIELVNINTREPKKQFVVQIKKVAKMRKNKDNSFSYEFETKFLYYVKAKVAESPAIVFVIEFETQICYYKYLSDEYLASLDFEGKENVTLRLSEADQISDIAVFYNTLDRIASERNLRFIDKSPEQIAEIQTAMEWLNKTMEELSFLKDMLPGFWKFGIANSNSISMNLSLIEKGHKTIIAGGASGANAFGLYLQTKGVLDTGIREFRSDPYFNTKIDFTNTTTPQIYVKEVIRDLLEAYFNKGILNVSFLSDKVLSEILFSFLDKIAVNANAINSICHKNIITADYKQEETVAHAKEILLYVVALFIDIMESKDDNVLKQIFNNMLKRSLYYDFKGIDIIDILGMHRLFIAKEKYNITEITFDTFLKKLIFLTKDYRLYAMVILELEKRKVTTIKRIWDISTSGHDGNKLERAIDLWLAELPMEYDSYYHGQFKKNDNYKFSTNIKYNIMLKEESFGCYMSMVYHRYENNKSIQIIRDKDIKFQIDYSKQERIISRCLGAFPIEFLNSKVPLYNGIKIFLWQGIAEYYNIDMRCDGVVIENMKHTLFKNK